MRQLLRFSPRKPGLTIVLLLLTGSLAPHTFAEPQTVKKQSTPANSIVLDSSLTILQSDDTPLQIRRAVDDLATDFGKVFGAKPRIVRRQEDAGAVTILIGEQSKLPEGIRIAGSADPESFSISVAKANWNKERATDIVVLSGADMRGTIYAVYEFSQKYLGIDPLYR